MLKDRKIGGVNEDETRTWVVLCYIRESRSKRGLVDMVEVEKRIGRIQGTR